MNWRTHDTTRGRGWFSWRKESCLFVCFARRVFFVFMIGILSNHEINDVSQRAGTHPNLRVFLHHLHHEVTLLRGALVGAAVMMCRREPTAKRPRGGGPICSGRGSPRRRREIVHLLEVRSHFIYLFFWEKGRRRVENKCTVERRVKVRRLMSSLGLEPQGDVVPCNRTGSVARRELRRCEENELLQSSSVLYNVTI